MAQISLICKDCNYKFKRNENQNTTCPYCGSKNTKEYKPVLAQDHLDRVLD